MPRPLPIGITDFRELREGGYHFVDKSMLIAECLRDGAKVLLLPRPRRFGKTLNLSMLRYFLDCRVSDQAKLFEGLDVTRHDDVMARAGQHPVVFFSLKECRAQSFEHFLDAFQKLLARLFEELISEDDLEGMSPSDRMDYKAITTRTASIPDLEDGLRLLMQILHERTGKRVWVLIDEYDAPIISGHLNDYYDEVVSLIRNFLGGALKDNPHLERGLLTGILRVAKESIFSGLNNVKVRSILSTAYQHFGFLEHEVVALLTDHGLESRLDGVRDWYNGYAFGKETVYNPWSILQFVDDPDDGLVAHWVNTSANDLARDLIIRYNVVTTNELSVLFQGGSVEAIIEDAINLRELYGGAVWSLLLYSGYLKSSGYREVQDQRVHTLEPPNREVRSFYRNAVRRWLEQRQALPMAGETVEKLVQGEMESFAASLAELARLVLSYHDTAVRPAEMVYHAFLLGMLVHLLDDYELTSNREAGLGRYDIALIPRDAAKQGFLFELKRCDEGDELDAVAAKALAQIRARSYADAMWSRGVNSVRAVGVAIDGKRVVVRHELLTR